MLARIPSQLLMEWMAYYSLEPFGQDAAYIGHAITASTIANTNRGKGSRPFKVEDFMPKFRQKPQTIDEQISFAAMITASMGGQDLRGERDDNSTDDPLGETGS
jgi:hypothetical protein